MDAKTTDDCFTPPAVFGAVVDYVFEKYNLPEETQIIRPFFPGWDYENTEYPAGSGTTLLAAANTGRRAYGFEIKKDFYKKACDLINHNITLSLF